MKHNLVVYEMDTIISQQQGVQNEAYPGKNNSKKRSQSALFKAEII